jgi:osmoprotectant transport system permease protein
MRGFPDVDVMSAITAYFDGHSGTFFTALERHLILSGASLGIACLVALPAGVFCARFEKAGNLVTSLFASLRIIPSLAVLFIALPVLGTGFVPAVAALTLLAIPPVLLNTTTALNGLDPAMLEAAAATGMGSERIFFLVKVPLAFPVVLAGVKTAAVEVLASATLAAYIGGGGLGDIIFTGLGLMRTELLVIGAVSVAALSIIVDITLSALEVRARHVLYGRNLDEKE